MQRISWLRICRHLSHVDDLRASVQSISRLQRTRKLTTQQPPGFGSHNPSTTAPRPTKSKNVNSDAGKPSDKERKDTGGSSQPDAIQTKPSKRFPIGFGKIFIFGIFAYVGYRVNRWATNPRRSRILDPYNFTPFILERRDKVSSTSSILNLASLPKGQNTDNVTQAWQKGVWSVQAMQPELQIARSYTPLPPVEDAEPEDLRLFVRKEPQGEVSNFLHRISRGTLVHLRGPHIEYVIPEDVDEVLFLAGGTGIAPALQVAHILYNYRSTNSENGPKLRILWANRRREDSYSGQEQPSLQQSQTVSAPVLGNLAEKDAIHPEDADAPKSQPQTALVAEVESLKARYPGKIEIDYFIDEEDSRITKSLLNDCLCENKREPDPATQDHLVRKKLLLVSGPEGFVDFYAGPKFMRGGKVIQGPLGGVLQQLNPQGWEIWKL